MACCDSNRRPDIHASPWTNFRQLSDRVGAAETSKFGVMGQEVQITSGTAKELVRERARLEQSSDETCTGKLKAIDQAAEELNSPIADLIGSKLLQTKGAVRLENLVHATLAALAPDKRPAEQPPMVILGVTRGVEKLLDHYERLATQRES